MSWWRSINARMYAFTNRMIEMSDDDTRLSVIGSLQRMIRFESWLARHGLRTRRRERRIAAFSLDVSRIYSWMDRADDAVEHVRRAMQIYSQLTERDPETYLPLLARAQTIAGWRFWAQRQDEAALAPTQHAVDNYWRLTATNPDRFAASLASVLHDLGMRLSELSRHQEAIHAETEALAILNPLAESDFEAHGVALAKLLYEMGETYAELGRKLEALDAHKRATDLWAEAAASNPGQFDTLLGFLLRDLGLEYSALERYEEAADVEERSVAIRRRLTDDDLNGHGHDFAFTLHNLGCTYVVLGRPEEALAVAQEAVDVYRRLVAAPVDLHERDRELELVILLDVLSYRLASVDRLEAALETGEEALRLARERARADKQHAQDSLVVVLRTLARLYRDLGRGDEAVLLETEADEIADRLEAEDN